MTDDTFDLLIRAGRVFCADSQFDEPGAVAICDGRFNFRHVAFGKILCRFG